MHILDLQLHISQETRGQPFTYGQTVTYYLLSWPGSIPQRQGSGMEILCPNIYSVLIFTYLAFLLLKERMDSVSVVFHCIIIQNQLLTCLKVWLKLS